MPKHSVSARYSAALAHAVEGRLDDAETALSEVLVQDPGNVEGHNNLGLVLQRLGRPEDAIDSFRRALIIRPAYVIALTNLGAALAALGRQDEAIECYEAALAHDAAYLPARNNLGAALHSLGRFDEAVGHLTSAVSGDPEFADARLNLGNALRESGRTSEALGQYLAAASLRENDPEVHQGLAELLHKAGRYDDAITAFNRATELNPRQAAAHAGLGHVLQEIGRIDEARLCFRRAIAEAPTDFAYYLNLAHITRLNADDPALLAMIELADNIDALSDDAQINAHFGLGKALAGIGQQEKSFAHFQAGNAIKRKTTDYNEKRTLGYLQKIKDATSSVHLEEWPRAASSDVTPIFILGMPRSGSTLVEQILSRHPSIRSAGETNTLPDTLTKYQSDNPTWRYPDPNFIPSEEQISEIAERYLQRLVADASATSAGQSSVWITDKMLSNFRHMGLITRLFPQARIIHTFRDPIETCMSCFSINFASQPFAFDLGELGRYYRAYGVMMRHWKRTLPEGAFFDVRYEAVAQNFEQSARAIVTYCGLDWHGDCLRFYEGDRPVRTASVEQVRRPIYQSSVRRWRPSDEVLAPLLEGLGLKSSTS